VGGVLRRSDSLMIWADIFESPYENAPFELRGRCRINILGNNFVPGLRSRLHCQ
jgi:hypothetical protein